MAVTFDDLWKLKTDKLWWEKIITATTKKDFQMDVWNGKHPVEYVTHICKAGTRVRIWMVSRFGDAGITDNLINPIGYNCRNVDVEKDLENITIENTPQTEEQRIENKRW